MMSNQLLVSYADSEFISKVTRNMEINVQLDSKQFSLKMDYSRAHLQTIPNRHISKSTFVIEKFDKSQSPPSFEITMNTIKEMETVLDKCLSDMKEELINLSFKLKIDEKNYTDIPCETVTNESIPIKIQFVKNHLHDFFTQNAIHKRLDDINTILAHPTFLMLPGTKTSLNMDKVFLNKILTQSSLDQKASMVTCIERARKEDEKLYDFVMKKSLLNERNQTLNMLNTIMRLHPKEEPLYKSFALMKAGQT